MNANRKFNRHSSWQFRLLIFCCAAVCFIGALVPRALARGGGGCFTAGTKILTPSGSVAIEQLRAGDEVLAFNADDQIVSAKIRNVLALEADEFFILRTERAEVRVTPEHPFYIGHGAFKTAELLAVTGQRYARKVCSKEILIAGTIGG